MDDHKYIMLTEGNTTIHEGNRTNRDQLLTMFKLDKYVEDVSL